MFLCCVVSDGDMLICGQLHPLVSTWLLAFSTCALCVCLLCFLHLLQV